MGGKSGGGDAPTSSGGMPEWARDAHTDLMARANTESRNTFSPYTGERVANESEGTGVGRQAITDMMGGNATSRGGRNALGGLISGTNERVDNAYDLYNGMSSGSNAVRDNAVAGMQGLTSGTNSLMDQGVSAYQGLSSGTNADMGAAMDTMAGLQSGTNAEMAGGTAATAASLGEYANLDNYDQGEYASFGKAAADKYMSPYQQAVTDMAKRNAFTDYQKANINRNSDMVSRGAFGGSRQAIIQGQADQALSQQMSDLQVQGLQDAYMNAQKQFGLDRDAQAAAFRDNSKVDQARAEGYLSGGKQLADIGNTVIGNQQTAADSLFDAGGSVYDNQATMAGNIFDAGQSQFDNRSGINENLLAAGQDQFTNASGIAGDMAGIGQEQFKNQAGIATDMIDAGQQQFDNDLAIGQEVYQMGKDSEALDQAQIDADYQDYLTDRDWSKNQMGWYSGIMTGAAPGFTNYTGENTGSGNVAANLLGLGTTAIGAIGNANS